MNSYIGCFGLIVIGIFILLLGLWSRRKRLEVGEFYKKHLLFLANEAPPLVSRAIGATNLSCLKGNLTTISGSEIPFYWWEWSTSSMIQSGASPQATISCFLAISFPPNVVSEEFERIAAHETQSNQALSHKLKDAFVLNTNDPIRTEKLPDGSFIIFWQILWRAEIMEAKLDWLKKNVTVRQ